MSTRGNIYVMDRFVGEIGSDAYPGGWWWEQFEELQGCTQNEFERWVRKEIEADRRPPKQRLGIGNWNYEYCWMPTAQPASNKKPKKPPKYATWQTDNGPTYNPYCDWTRWTGHILVRTIDHELTWKRFGKSYWQVPGPWYDMREFLVLRELQTA